MNLEWSAKQRHCVNGFHGFKVGGGVGGGPHVSDCVHETVSVWREPRVLSISEFVALERKWLH